LGQDAVGAACSFTARKRRLVQEELWALVERRSICSHILFALFTLVT
jgi:hypothetical protein